MHCPKCQGLMQTFNRNGVQIEQCGNCRGIFLDYGELEALTRVEGQWNQPVAPPQQGYPAQQAYPAPQQAYPAGPAWGAPHGGHHGHHQKHRSFGHMLFSS
ncbi:zf-TFIIB domain-containing protein [Streptomyces sp. NPDC006733]|uniref:TFIIB-type zinc ribbon-containing protein n=1 Tax=Streptomyces sp. NPDC006733 TaxID=3155460 RepID=UPI0033EA5F74